MPTAALLRTVSLEGYPATHRLAQDTGGTQTRPLIALTWTVDAPLVTVTDPATPRLMAR